MIEIEEFARRAIESPVAPPPELARIVALAHQQRRTRRVRRTGVALGLTGVAVAAIVSVSALPTNDSGLRVTATSLKSATSTTVTGSPQGRELTTAALTDRLTRSGHRVASDGTASGSPFGVDAQLLCVDRIQVRVYQYRDSAARAAISAGIRADGSSIEVPLKGSTNRALVEWLWAGPPHFFANGRIIVLVLQDDGKLLQDLARILGPTVSPRAVARTAAKSPCTTTMP